MSPRGRGDDAFESLAVLLSSDCRALRRALRPLVWMTLEEVALDAVAEDGRLVARTSARQVAEHLGIDAGTAATALRALRERGLVSSSREKGPGGRFGLSVYELAPVAGLSVVQPRTAGPLVVSPSVAPPVLEEPGMVSPHLDAPHVESPRLETSDPAWPDSLGPGTGASPVATDSDSSGVTGGAVSACRPGASEAPSAQPGPAVRCPGSLRCPGQETFDLGSASS